MTAINQPARSPAPRTIPERAHIPANAPTPTAERTLRSRPPRANARAVPNPRDNDASPREAEAPPPERGTSAGRTLFEISFSSDMTDHDSALLARLLDMTTRLHPKMAPRHDSPGLARLDHYSGLFLRRGEADGDWTLEARTWGQPSAQSVHDWQVLAAVAAHRLDPKVIPPERLTVSSAQVPDHPVGRAANRRLARLRRRLAGVR